MQYTIRDLHDVRNALQEHVQSDTQQHAEFKKSITELTEAHSETAVEIAKLRTTLTTIAGVVGVLLAVLQIYVEIIRR